MTAMTYAQVLSQGLEEWRVVLEALRTSYVTPDMAAGAAFVSDVVARADAANHHPDITVRYGRVDVDLVSHDVGGITTRDIELARQITEVAAQHGLSAQPRERQALELAVDALDIAAVYPFWQAVTGARDLGDGRLLTPDGLLIWFQQMDAPRHEHRNRLHLDVTVPGEVADRRIEAARAAGGTLKTDRWAPAFWVLADPEDNEVCVCTAAGRD